MTEVCADYYGPYTHEHEGYTFGLQHLADVLPECEAMLEAQWDEVIRNTEDFEMDPDYKLFIALQSKHRFLYFTARDDAGELVGHCGMGVGPSATAKNTIEASERMLYVVPEHRRRGLARAFVAFLLQYLEDIGIDTVDMGDRSPGGSVSLSSMYKDLGMSATSVVYSKDLRRA